MQKEIENYWVDCISDFKPDSSHYDFFKIDDSSQSSETFSLVGVMYDNIKQMAGDDKTKQFILICSLLQITQARYFQQQNTVLISPLLVTEKLHANLTSIIPLTSLLDWDISLKEAISLNGNNYVKAYRYQHFFSDKDNSLKEIIKANIGIYSPDVHGLFEFPPSVRFIIQINLSDENVEIIFLDRENQKTDFYLGFKKLFIQLFGYLKQALVSVKSIPWYSEAELLEMKKTYLDIRDQALPKSLINLFESQVLKNPTAPALTFKDQSLSYDELNKKVNRFSNYLIEEYNLTGGEGVLLYLNKSMHMYIAILAILKCRAFYIPIRIKALDSELEFIQKTTNANFVIVESKNLDRFKNFENNIIAIDLENEQLVNPDTNPLIKSDQDNTAYIMFTSGSTGVPKGVQINQSSIINLIVENPFNTTNSNRKVLQLSPYGFDGSVFDIFSALLGGAHLFADEDDMLTNPKQLLKFIKSKGIDQMLIVTPLFNHIADLEPQVFSQFKTIYFGGQESSVSHVKKVLKEINKDTQLFHLYGTTECTVINAFHLLTMSDAYNLHIPIGKQINGTGILILDQFGHIVFPYVEGEIHVCGEGVGAGYLNDQTRTDERFISLPQYHLKKTYKTGDYGCWKDNGDVLYLGRKDGQFQISGYRIEVGEICNMLLRNNKIHKIHLTTREDKITGNRELLAYYTGDISSVDLRKYASDVLPSYKVPAFFIKLDQVILKPNGKVDESKLPEPANDKTDFIAPQTIIEKEVAKIWEELFEIEQVSKTDDFFKLGGQSIKAMQIMAYVSERLKLDIQIADVFMYPLLEDLAKFIEESKGNRYKPLIKIPFQKKYPLSFHQKPLWLAQKAGQKTAYNSVFYFEITGNIDIKILVKAFNYVVENNDILRTVIIEELGEPFQVVKDKQNVIIDVQKLTDDSFSMIQLKEYVKSEQNYNFNLEDGPLFRVTLFENNGCYMGIFTIHHIIFDARSIDILLNEIKLKYNLVKNGIAVYKEKDKLQFIDFSSWYNDLFNEGQLSSQKKYWFDLLKDSHKICDFQANDVTGESSLIVFGKEQTLLIQQIAHKHNITVFACIYMMYQVHLFKYLSIEKLVIATPASFRINKDLDGMIGYFINLVPLRSHIEGQMSLIDILIKSYESIKDSLDNRLISINMVIDELRKLYGHDFYPFDTTMTYVDQRDAKNNESSDTSELNIRTSDLQMKFDTARFNMEFIITHLKDEIQILIIYKSSIYEQTDIEQIRRTFSLILTLLMYNETLLLNEVQLDELVIKN